MMMKKIFLSLSVMLVFVSAIPIYGMGSVSQDQPVGPETPVPSPRSSPAAIMDNMEIDEITDDKLRQLGGAEPRGAVTKLNILNGEDITDAGISFLTELKELEIFGGTFTGAGLRNLQNLTSLKVDHCDAFTNAYLRFLPKLTSLEVNFCPNFVSEGLNSSLISLKVAACDAFTGVDLCCPILTSLSVTLCDGFTGIGLSPELTSLTVWDCYLFTGETLHFLEKLKSLRVDFCRSFTGAGLSQGLIFLKVRSCGAFVVEHARNLLNLQTFKLDRVLIDFV